jgi:hypothetical protein
VPKNGGVVTEQRVDCGFVPDVEFALLAFGIGGLG